MKRVPPQALKGRAKGSPFQGSAVEMEGAVRPRALPWARLGRPFGAQADCSAGAPMHRGAPRTRATSLSPRPIRGRFGLPVAQALLPVRSVAEASALGTGRSACATGETTYYSRAFSDDGQPWYAVKIPRVVSYKRAGVFDGGGGNPGILGGDRLPPPHGPNLAPSRTQLPV